MTGKHVVGEATEPGECHSGLMPNGSLAWRMSGVIVVVSRYFFSCLGRFANPLGDQRNLGAGRTSMQRFLKNVKSFLKSEDGPTAVEYAVMLALIIVVCLGAVTTIGTNANSTFDTVGQKLSAASP